MGHWTACHYTATPQTWWTCLRQGPEREFNVRLTVGGAGALPFRKIQI